MMDSEERWAEVEEFPMYAISDFGRVMNVISGRILKPAKTKAGYFRVTLYNEYEQKAFSVHHLVAFAFIDGYFEGAETNHIDGCKLNNMFKNLEWCTMSENRLHAYALGLKQPVRAYKRVRCIETEEIFPSVTATANHFNISIQLISNVIHGYRKTARGHTFELVD